MKKIILLLIAVIVTLDINADATTTTVNVIRIYSSERTDDPATLSVDESTFPVAEYQNLGSDKYRAELKNGVIEIYKNSDTTPINTFINGEYNYRAELQKINITVDGADSKGRKYVDLGLTSGTLWAKTNVGGSVETDYGNYYAWGETAAFGEVPNAYPQNKTLDWDGSTCEKYSSYVTSNSIKEPYHWQNYKWTSNYVSNTVDKDNTLSKYLDSSHSILETSDDAAIANLGNNWCMPTQEQITKLIEETDCYWITLNGISGYRLVKKEDTERYIFLPAANVIYQNGLQTEGIGTFGFYWSKNLGSDYYYPYYIYFNPVYIDIYNDSDAKRCMGLSVRPVYLTTPITINPVTSITVTSEGITVGNTVTLTANVYPSTATYSNVTWSSDKESVATVNALGVVTGVGAGTATITATAVDGTGVTGTCTVTVSE